MTIAIRQKEEQLTQHPLIIHDSRDITEQASGFTILNNIDSPRTDSSVSGIASKTIMLSTDITEVNLLPPEGFIEFGSDGLTRIFSSDGNETAYAVDERTEWVITPSGSGTDYRLFLSGSP